MAEMILKATGSKLKIISEIHVTSTQAQYDTCLFEFDEAWDGYGVRTAVFYSNPNNIKAMLLDGDNKCYIPWDAFSASRYLYIGVYGSNGESYLPTQFVEVMYQPGANVDDHLYPPTPGIYEQIVIGLTNKADKSALDDAIALIGGNADDIDYLTTQLAEIEVDVRKFGAKCDGVTDDTLALANALESNYKTIKIPNAVMYIKEGNISVDAGINKKLLGENGATIKFDFDTSKYGIKALINIEFENITFDFNDKHMISAISFPVDVGIVKLTDITVQNVRDMDIDTSSTAINIGNASALYAKRLTFNNLRKKPNGVFGDGGGNITGIYYWSNTELRGSIDWVFVNELHNIDDNDNIVFEDTSGVYVYCPNRSNSIFEIANISGFNYGKRLIKTQASDLLINNVTGHSDIGDVLVCVGVQDLAVDGDTDISIKNVRVKNVKVTGKCANAFSSSIDGVYLDGLFADTIKPDIAGNSGDSSVIQFSGKNASFTNINGKSKKGVVLSKHGIPSVSVSPVENVTITNSTFQLLNDNGTALQIAGLSTMIKNLKIRNVNIITESATQAFVLHNGETTSIDGLDMRNIKINNKMTISGGVFVMGGTNLVIEDIEANYDSGSPYNFITCTGSNNVKIKDVNLINPIDTSHVVCGTNNCTDILFDNIQATNSNYILSATNASNATFKNVDFSKLTADGAVNLKYERGTSKGSSSVRPVESLFQGLCFFDTTLNKPIWWNGTSWIDATGTTA